MKVLMWVSCAKRFLEIEELQHALATEPGDTSLNTLNLSEVDLLVGVCIGLVDVDQGNNTLRLIHYTLRNYLQTKRMFLDGDRLIADTCLTYLSFDRLEQDICGDIIFSLSGYPLIAYIRYLFHHISPQAEFELHDAIIFLFTRKPKTTKLLGFSGGDQGSALHTAVTCALLETTRLLLRQFDPLITRMRIVDPYYIV